MKISTVIAIVAVVLTGGVILGLVVNHALKATQPSFETLRAVPVTEHPAYEEGGTPAEVETAGNVPSPVAPAPGPSIIA